MTPPEIATLKELLEKAAWSLNYDEMLEIIEAAPALLTALEYSQKRVEELEKELALANTTER